ncbi:PAAR domain-containing protein [Paraburkholderia azotifigens]
MSDTYPDGPSHGINKVIEAHPTLTIGGERIALHGRKTECGCSSVACQTATVEDQGLEIPEPN